MDTTGDTTWQRERLLEALDAYNRGLVDAPLLRKQTESQAPDARQAQAPGPALEMVGRMTFAISTEEVDRHGDVLTADGWRLESYLQNPVFLWAHDYARPVIGRAARVWKGARELLAEMDWAPTDFAQEVAMLYRSGYQRGVSVGFRPIRYEERRDARTGAFLGIRFLEQELLEVSAVPVPANRSALRRAIDALDNVRLPAPWVAEYLPSAGPGTDPAAILELADVIADLRKSLWEIAGEPESFDRHDPHNIPQWAQIVAAIREARPGAAN